MSLPPKLLERLKKRGIVKEEKKYDDYVLGCPNKYDINHDCTYNCEKQFGEGTKFPSNKVKKIYQALIKNYPLEKDWQEVWEPGCYRYYFWNTITDEVSWYPNGHPSFKLTKSSIFLKKEKLKEANKDLIEDDKQLINDENED